MMVIVNRIVSILILLAAIAAVVFSYMLFSKRTQIVAGWNTMASAIQTAAKTLDDGGASGTIAAKELAMDKLKLSNAAQLGQVLPKLKDNAQKIVTQRNEFAATIKETSGYFAISGIEDTKLRSVVTFQQQEKQFKNKMREIRTMRTTIANGYAQTGRIFGAQVSPNDFNDAASFRSAVSRINSAATDVKNRRDVYANYLRSYSSAIGVPAPNLNSVSYRSSLESTLSEYRKHQREFNQTRSQLASAQRTNDSLKKQVSNLNQQIKGKNQTIARKDGEIRRLTSILTKDGTIALPEKMLTSADKEECYKFVRGKIEYIDKEYGFVTIDIGKKFIFTQNYGIKKNMVHFPLEVGKIMTVARGFNTDKPEYIGKIIVTKVDDNRAICNLMDGNPAKYKVGDSVYFSDEDIKLALKTSGAKGTAKKK